MVTLKYKGNPPNVLYSLICSKSCFLRISEFEIYIYFLCNLLLMPGNIFSIYSRIISCCFLPGRKTCQWKIAQSNDVKVNGSTPNRVTRHNAETKNKCNFGEIQISFKMNFCWICILCICLRCRKWDSFSFNF